MGFFASFSVMEAGAVLSSPPAASRFHHSTCCFSSPGKSGHLLGKGKLSVYLLILSLGYRHLLHHGRWTLSSRAKFWEISGVSAGKTSAEMLLCPIASTCFSHSYASPYFSFQQFGKISSSNPPIGLHGILWLLPRK